jgi:hypothetical protein
LAHGRPGVCRGLRELEMMERLPVEKLKLLHGVDPLLGRLSRRSSVLRR